MVAGAVELAVGELEVKVRSMVLELHNPLVMRMEQLAEALNALRVDMTTAQKSVDMLEVQIQKAHLIDTFRADLMQSEENRVKHEFKVEAEMEAVRSELETFRYSLDRKQTAIENQAAEGHKLQNDFHRLETSQKNAERKLIEVVEAGLTAVKTSIAEGKRNHGKLVEDVSSFVKEVWSEDRGIGGLSREINRSNRMIGELMEGIDAITIIKTQIEGILRVLDDQKREQERQKEEERQLDQRISGLLTSIDEKFKATSTHIATQTASFIKETRDAYKKELDHNVILRDETSELLKRSKTSATAMENAKEDLGEKIELVAKMQVKLNDNVERHRKACESLEKNPDVAKFVHEMAQINAGNKPPPLPGQLHTLFEENDDHNAQVAAAANEMQAAVMRRDMSGGVIIENGVSNMNLMSADGMPGAGNMGYMGGMPPEYMGMHYAAQFGGKGGPGPGAISSIDYRNKIVNGPTMKGGFNARNFPHHHGKYPFMESLDFNFKDVEMQIQELSKEMTSNSQHYDTAIAEMKLAVGSLVESARVGIMHDIEILKSEAKVIPGQADRGLSLEFGGEESSENLNEQGSEAADKPGGKPGDWRSAFAKAGFVDLSKEAQSGDPTKAGDPKRPMSPKHGAHTFEKARPNHPDLKFVKKPIQPRTPKRPGSDMSNRSNRPGSKMSGGHGKSDEDSAGQDEDVTFMEWERHMSKFSWGLENQSHSVTVSRDLSPASDSRSVGKRAKPGSPDGTGENLPRVEDVFSKPNNAQQTLQPTKIDSSGGGPSDQNSKPGIIVAEFEASVMSPSAPPSPSAAVVAASGINTLNSVAASEARIGARVEEIKAGLKKYGAQVKLLDAAAASLAKAGASKPVDFTKRKTSKTALKNGPSAKLAMLSPRSRAKQLPNLKTKTASPSCDLDM